MVKEGHFQGHQSNAGAKKRKGLSLEEKRDKMLEIFHESADFFLLKELEKRGPKKGVISQSVKDVVQSLVDDDMVSKEKIGTSVYFWSLPSAAGQKLRQEEEGLAAQVAGLKEKKTKLQEKIQGAQEGREGGEARDDCVARLAHLQERNSKLKAEIAELAQNDPEAFAAKKKSLKVCLEAANRWTENIYSLQHWCNNNCPGTAEQLEGLYKECGIPTELDYIQE